MIPDRKIELVCSHPPYGNAIRYSKDTPGDLSLLEVVDFSTANAAGGQRELPRDETRRPLCTLNCGLKKA